MLQLYILFLKVLKEKYYFFKQFKESFYTPNKKIELLLLLRDIDITIKINYGDQPN